MRVLWASIDSSHQGKCSDDELGHIPSHHTWRAALNCTALHLPIIIHASSGEHPQTPIPEYSLQSLYTPPAIAKNPPKPNNPGTLPAVFLPGSTHGGAGLAVGLNNLAPYPSDTLTQPLS